MSPKRLFPPNGGYLFAVDPELPAPSAHAAWSPAADPWTLILRAIPARFAPARAASSRLPTTASSQAHDHISDERLDVGAEIFRAQLVGIEPGDAPRAAVILLDDATPDRLEALARYWRGLSAPPAPADPRVTPQRRKRLCQMLRVVDARLEHESYRAIAMALFPTHDIDAASWAGDALRETTIRLARDGMKLVHGGYRDLLKRARKP